MGGGRTDVQAVAKISNFLGDFEVIWWYMFHSATHQIFRNQKTRFFEFDLHYWGHFLWPMFFMVGQAHGIYIYKYLSIIESFIPWHCTLHQMQRQQMVHITLLSGTATHQTSLNTLLLFAKHTLAAAGLGYWLNCSRHEFDNNFFGTSRKSQTMVLKRSYSLTIAAAW